MSISTKFENKVDSPRYQFNSLISLLQYIAQRQLFVVLFFSACIFLSGCGGGGGVYYPPEIAINSINLHKIELAKTGIVSYEPQFFPVSYDDRSLRDKPIEEGRKIFNTYGYFQKTQFLGREYYLHRNNWFQGVDVIDKSDMKKVLFLDTPRYVFLFASFPLAIKNRDYLVVYIEQQKTSHSSTLFIIDSQFKIVYREHLLGAEGIGFTHSDKYGNCIILKSENSWLANGIDKPRVSINGDWLYYIPHGQENESSE